MKKKKGDAVFRVGTRYTGAINEVPHNDWGGK